MNTEEKEWSDKTIELLNGLVKKLKQDGYTRDYSVTRHYPPYLLILPTYLASVFRSKHQDVIIRTSPKYIQIEIGGDCDKEFAKKVIAHVKEMFKEPVEEDWK